MNAQDVLLLAAGTIHIWTAPAVAVLFAIVWTCVDTLYVLAHA